MPSLSRLEVQKRILEEVNRRVDNLVSEILMQAETTRASIDVANMSEINQIIDMLEKMDFKGNVQLLKDTVAVYDKAITAITEQLESEASKDFEDYSIDSLKDAKKLLEEQSKAGRVGTMISKLDELSIGEASGTIEKDHNDEQIERLDFSIKEREKQESQRMAPYNKIISVTRKPIETLDRYNGILHQIEEIDKKIDKLKKELAKPDIKEAEKNSKKAEIKSLSREKLELYKSAKKDEADKEFDFDPTKESASDYFKRVKGVLDGRVGESRLYVINALETIKDEEIDVGTTRVKIGEYLKDYMNIANLSKVDELAKKIDLDKKLAKKAMEQEEEHKDMESLKEKKQVYKERNDAIEQSSPRSMDNGTGILPIPYERKKWDWRHPFKSIKALFKKDVTVVNPKGPVRSGEETEKFILAELESKMKGDDFRRQYTVPEQDRIATEVEQTLNDKREEFYRQQNQQRGER